MINVIYGAKGSGKTKQIVADANAFAPTAKGVVVYFDRSNHRMHDLHRNVRLVDASYYGIQSQRDILYFVKGMLATNFDIERIYVDGLSRLLDCNIADLEELYSGLDAISAEHKVDFTITASGALEDLPAFVKKHVK